MILIYTKNNENILKPIVEDGDDALKEYNSLLEQYGDDISSISLVADDIAFFSRSGNADGWEALMHIDSALSITEEDHIDMLEEI
jgi:hypothetical protein